MSASSLPQVPWPILTQCFTGIYLQLAQNPTMSRCSPHMCPLLQFNHVKLFCKVFGSDSTLGCLREERVPVNFSRGHIWAFEGTIWPFILKYFGLLHSSCIMAFLEGRDRSRLISIHNLLGSLSHKPDVSLLLLWWVIIPAHGTVRQL